MLKIAIELIIILLAWFLLVSFYAFYSSIHPKKILSHRTPAEFGFSYENVSFQTEDNLTLRGWFVPASLASQRSGPTESQGGPTVFSPAKTVIVLHGYPAEKGDVLNWALFLHDKYHLLFFDFRYFGESEGGYTTVGWEEKKDLKAAIDYLFSRDDTDPEKVGVLGFSLGGATAIMTAPDTPEIKAIVADSSYATLEQMAESLFQRFSVFKKPMVWSVRQWSKIWLKFDPGAVSPVASVEKNTTPLLLIHGEKDQEIPVEHSRQIFQAAKGPAELWTVSSADHGSAYFQEKELYEKKVLEFFGKYLDQKK